MGLLYLGFRFVTRPPDLGRMSNGALSRHVAKARRYLQDSAGVVVGQISGDKLKLLLYPLDGRAPFLLDVADGLNYRSTSPAYEPAFLYWRISHRKAPVLKVLRDFYDSYIGGGFYSLINYKAPTDPDFARFVVDLDNFDIASESEFFGSEQGDWKGILLPSPVGTKYYLIGEHPRFTSAINFKMFDTPGDGAAHLLGSYEFHLSDWTDKDDKDVENAPRYFIGEPQPSETGVIASAYAIAVDRSTGEDTIEQAGFLKFEPANESDERGRVVKLAMLNRSPGDSFSGDLNKLYFFHYAEKEGAALAYRFDENSNRQAVTMFLMDSATGALTKICRLSRISSIFLVDYDRSLMFFVSYGKPEPPLEKASEHNENDANAESTSETKDTIFHLNRLDFKTMQVAPIAELRAAQYRMYDLSEGMIYYGAPVITLCEKEETIVAIDGDKLVTIGYDGKRLRTLATDPKTSWNLLYAANRVAER